MDEPLRLSSGAGRWALTVAILGSGMALLDSTVVNVALPALGADLGATIADVQWVLNAYLLTLAALILIGGSLGDRYGRRRIFVIGVVWFGVASLGCGLAQDPFQLIAARGLQGVGAALLTPGSLAIIQASFHPDDRGRAIGAWSALGGIAAAVGPLLGGWLVDAASWRWVFWINLPVTVVVVILALRFVPETRDTEAHGRFDSGGALLGALGLGAITYSLVEAERQGFGAIGVAAVGGAALIGFVVVERVGRDPMVPPRLFASRQFTAANVVTFAVYAALGVLFFLLVLQLQVVSGYSAVTAGAALLPVTVIMLLLSSRAGDLAVKIGPRWPMTLGPAIAGVGALLLVGVGTDAPYVSAVLPGVAVFGLGLALTVAPLTTTVLAAAEQRYAGVASGVNNAVARVGGLFSVAAVPLVVGLSGTGELGPQSLDAGFGPAMLICAALLALGAVIAALTIRNPATHQPSPAGSGAECRVYCAVGAPPLEASRAESAHAS